MFTVTVVDTLLRSLGDGYLIIAFGLMGAVPLGLLALLIFGLYKGHGPRFGLFIGIAVAFWAIICWIVVPYCGAYPNIPGGVLGAAAFGVGTWGQEISVHVTNLLLWPFPAYVLFKELGRSKSENALRTADGRGPPRHV